MSELTIIRENSEIGEKILLTLINSIKVGMSTAEIISIGEKEFKKYGVDSATKYLGYNRPVSIAINEEVFFGDISTKKNICDGDVVKFALGVFNKGYFTDMGYTIIVGNPSFENQILVRGTAKALLNVLGKLKEGVTIEEISGGIERTLKDYNLTPLKTIMGHRVSKNLHEPPSIPNCLDLPYVNYNYALENNSVICIEPIATRGNAKISNTSRLKYVTHDKKQVAHFELPILITKDSFEVLTSHLLIHMKKHQFQQPL